MLQIAHTTGAPPTAHYEDYSDVCNDK